MSLAKKILSNTLAQVGGKIVMGLLSIITLKILTNYLTKGQYGEYTYIYDFLALFGILADLGLYTIGVREISRAESLGVAEKSKKIEKILANILGIRTVAGIVGMIIAVIASFYAYQFVPLGAGADQLSQTELTIAIALGAITVFLALINGTITTILQASLKMQQASIAMILGRIVAIGYMFYTVTVAYSHNVETGFFHLVFAGVVGNIVMTAVTWYYARKLAPVRYEFDWSFWKNILGKSLPFGVALILSTIYFRTNTILLRFAVGPEEVAIYAVAGRIMTEAVTVALYFMNSVLPVLTHSVTTKDGRHGKIIQYSFDFLTMTMIPLIIGGWILAYPMIKIVSEPKYLSRLSENFYGSDAVFQILLIAMFVAFLTTLFSFVLVALNEQKKLLWINLGGILVNLALNSFMIPLYTSRGAAVTSIIAEIFLTITSLLVARRYLKFTISIRNTAKALVAGVIMGVVVYLLRDPSFTLMENKNLLILIPLGIIIYTGFVFLFKAIPQEAIALFRKKATPEQTTEPL